MQFKDSLATGKSGETEIATWLKSRGNSILPIYEIAENQFKGPALYGFDNSEIIAPDMLCFGKGKLFFVEAKHKNAFAWYRNHQKFVTGIDLHHYEQYLKFCEYTSLPLWLFFLHRGGAAKDSEVSPSGLFANEIGKLSQTIDHTSDKWGKHGMIYWGIESLHKFSDYPLQK